MEISNGTHKAFEYLTGTPLFQLHETDTASLEDVHLQRMSEHLGPFPETFLNECGRRKEYFDTSGEVQRHWIGSRHAEVLYRHKATYFTP